MTESLYESHQALREQIRDFGINSYIVGQKIDDGAHKFKVAEVEHAARSPRAVLRERDKLEFPNWPAVQIGARYMIVKFFEDNDRSRDQICQFTVFGDQFTEQDALHAAYVPLEVPLDGLRVDLPQEVDSSVNLSPELIRSSLLN